MCGTTEPGTSVRDQVVLNASENEQNMTPTSASFALKVSPPKRCRTRRHRDARNSFCSSRGIPLVECLPDFRSTSSRLFSSVFCCRRRVIDMSGSRGVDSQVGHVAPSLLQTRERLQPPLQKPLRLVLLAEIIRTTSSFALSEFPRFHVGDEPLLVFAWCEFFNGVCMVAYVMRLNETRTPRALRIRVVNRNHGSSGSCRSRVRCPGGAHSSWVDKIGHCPAHETPRCSRVFSSNVP